MGPQASADQQAARGTADRIGELERRLAEITGRRPTPAIVQVAPRRPPLVPARSWEELRGTAAERLTAWGLDPGTVDLDALLDPTEAAAIHRAFSGGISIQTRLDAVDVAFVVVAGIAAAVVDFLVVRIPSTRAEK